MKCDKCKQREATITIAEVVNKKQIKTYLCEKCANESEGIILNNTFEEFLSGILNEHEKKEHVQILQCNNCGMTLAEFKMSSKLGCANCYATFNNYLTPVLKRMHGNIKHTGKVSKKQLKEIETINEIVLLDKKLSEAIKKEEYEDAAKYRDMIRDLKKEASDI